MPSQTHSAVSLNGTARLRNIRTFDKFLNFITTQRAMYVFTGYKLSGFWGIFLKSLYTTIVKLKSFKKAPHATQ